MEINNLPERLPRPGGSKGLLILALLACLNLSGCRCSRSWLPFSDAYVSNDALIEALEPVLEKRDTGQGSDGYRKAAAAIEYWRFPESKSDVIVVEDLCVGDPAGLTDDDRAAITDDLGGRLTTLYEADARQRAWGAFHDLCRQVFQGDVVDRFLGPDELPAEPWSEYGPPPAPDDPKAESTGVPIMQSVFFDLWSRSVLRPKLVSVERRGRKDRADVKDEADDSEEPIDATFAVTVAGESRALTRRLMAAMMTLVTDFSEVQEGARRFLAGYLVGLTQDKPRKVWFPISLSQSIADSRYLSVGPDSDWTLSGSTDAAIKREVGEFIRKNLIEAKCYAQPAVYLPTEKLPAGLDYFRKLAEIRTRSAGRAGRDEFGYRFANELIYRLPVAFYDPSEELRDCQNAQTIQINYATSGSDSPELSLTVKVSWRPLKFAGSLPKLVPVFSLPVPPENDSSRWLEVLETASNTVVPLNRAKLKIKSVQFPGKSSHVFRLVDLPGSQSESIRGTGTVNGGAVYQLAGEEGRAVAQPNLVVAVLEDFHGDLVAFASAMSRVGTAAVRTSLVEAFDVKDFSMLGTLRIGETIDSGGLFTIETGYNPLGSPFRFYCPKSASTTNRESSRFLSAEKPVTLTDGNFALSHRNMTAIAKLLSNVAKDLPARERAQAVFKILDNPSLRAGNIDLLPDGSGSVESVRIGELLRAVENAVSGDGFFQTAKLGEGFDRNWSDADVAKLRSNAQTRSTIPALWWDARGDGGQGNVRLKGDGAAFGENVCCIYRAGKNVYLWTQNAPLQPFLLKRGN